MTSSDNPPSVDIQPSAAAEDKWTSKPLVRAAKLALFLLVMFFVVRAVAERLRGVTWSDFRMDAGYALLAVVSQVAAMLIWAATHRVLLGDLCDMPHARVTLAVFWVARMGKFIPGKLTSVVGATWMLRKRGVPPGAALNAILLYQGLWLVLGFMTAVPLTLWQPVRDALPMAWFWCIVFVTAGGICLHPRIFLGLGNAILRKLKLPPLEASHDLRRYLKPLIMMLANIALAGFTLWALSRSVTQVSAALVPMFMSAAALGATVGFLAIFTPGGLGVREGILLIVLSPIVGSANSAVIIVASRLLQIIAEAALAGVGLLLLWHDKKKNPQ